MKWIYALAIFLLIHLSCKKDENKTASGTMSTSTSTTSSTGSGTNPVKCDTSVVQDGRKNGCYPRLVTPAMCETIDLRNGKVYEFAWTTDGTICETPWTFQIAGNPITAQNVKTWSLATNVDQGITKYGGIINVSLLNLEGLTTDNGLYHWTVTSFYDSYPASQTFKLSK
jgi:hypothetical protein